MPEPAPANVQIFAFPTYTQVSWTNMDAYDHVVIWKKVGDGEYSSYDTILYPTDYYDDNTYDYPNTRLYYKLKAYREPYVPSDFSDEVTLCRFADTVTVTVVMTPSVSGQCAFTDTVTDTVSMTPSFTGSCGFSNTVTDTITMTTALSSSQTIKTDYAYYLGADSGPVYEYSPDYTGDNLSSIVSSWRSKATDFSELNIKFAGIWKTVYRFSVWYVDLSSGLNLTAYVSTDGGTTWSSSSASAGTASNATARKDFFFIKSGEFFEFKIESASSDKKFQIIAMQAEFEPFGEVVA